MRLDVGSIAIQDVELGARTALRDHTLVVNPDEVRRLVLEDPHFSDVEVHIARPGESVRIIHVVDVLEPRWKVAGPGGVFPGFVSPPTMVGEGTTHRLASAAVVQCGEPVPGESTHFREQLIDMAGPGAQYSPFGQTLNVVLHFKPNLDFFPPGAADVIDVLGGGAAAAEYNRALTAAGTKVAAFLGRTSQQARPDQVETFELAPSDPGLPKVVCAYQQVLSALLYGVPVDLPTGTLVHPNELFDGALIGRRGGTTPIATYFEQNNEALRQLCHRHGKDLTLLGCILFGSDSRYRAEKERVASAPVRLARLLGAQAALFLGINGSNLAVDLMWALQRCEQADIKTTLVFFDMGYGPDDPGFVFAVPEADAVVCTGSRDQRVTLPPMQKLIGGDRLVDPDADAREEITVIMRYVHGATGIQGYNHLTTRFQ